MSAIWPGALLTVYLAAGGALLIIRWPAVPAPVLALHLAVLAAVAATTWLRRTPEWLRLWAPIMSLLFLYSEIPHLISAAGHERLYDMKLIQWERVVFGSQPSVDWAARWQSFVFSEVLHAAYLSYYGIIVSVPAGLYAASRRREFSEAVFVLMLTFVACFAVYVVFPVAGPRYLWSSPIGAQAGPFRDAAVWLLEARSSRGTAFPSSHVAVAVTQSILAIRYFGRRGLAVPVLTVGLALGAVYGGFHYALDVVAGLAFGVVFTAVGLRRAQRPHHRDHANASAPT